MQTEGGGLLIVADRHTFLAVGAAKESLHGVADAGVVLGTIDLKGRHMVVLDMTQLLKEQGEPW